MQRVALTLNDRLERLFRKQPGLERRLRTLYYRVNGRARGASVPDSVRHELAERYEEPNLQLEKVLRDAGDALPRWLGDGPDGAE
jgi:hypothetical protein